MGDITFYNGLNHTDLAIVNLHAWDKLEAFQLLKRLFSLNHTCLYFNRTYKKDQWCKRNKLKDMKKTLILIQYKHITKKDDTCNFALLLLL